MNTKRICLECGTEIPPSASDGLCPRCLLGLGEGEDVGMVIGRYKLLQKIGEGGMGAVYIAEQTEPVIRKVALKILKLGMDTREVVARFEAERQALALMDHPNIAKVLDGGATDNGRPYFVMELVHGVPITEYCDNRRLSIKERLKLFVEVCRAVQHAHQKGIIHRDLKPSNILVTENDGVSIPKVIDFGIAKATAGQKLTDKTLFTAFEQFLGTPAYMSPEQAAMTSLDIDTRTDIYSLGVLLYELLTGKTPFDARELARAGFDEMRRTIREKEPARPSARLSTLSTEELTAVASRRHTDPPRLIHLLGGDPDWIVMKCLEKDRARRYETANAVGMDILRHLNCEPVQACPPSRWYEFQKSVRRHKIGFATAGVVVIALLAGLGLASFALRGERRARREAEAVVAALLDFQRAAGNSLVAARALGRLGDAGVAPFLTELRDSDPQARERAAMTLGHILMCVPKAELGQHVMGPLVAALRDKDVRVRKAAAQALQHVVPLVDDARVLSIIAPSLVAAMREEVVGSAGTAALVRVSERNLEVVLSFIEGGRQPSAGETGIHRRTLTHRLVRVMAENEGMLGFGAETLRSRGETSLGPLIEALHDEDVSIRKAAAIALQVVLPAIRNSSLRAEAVEPLARVAEHDPVVRGYALAALERVRTDEAKKVLLEYGINPQSTGANPPLGLQVVQWGRGSDSRIDPVMHPPAGLTNVVAIGAGGSHSVALRADGTVVAWGEGMGRPGRMRVPGDLSNVVSIAVGYDHTLALRRDGTVVAWGDERVAIVPKDLTNVVSIAAGRGHNAALLDDGTVRVWGTTVAELLDVPPEATNVAAIAAGWGHCLALTEEGMVIVWGNDTVARRNVPPSVTNIVAIAAGYGHSLALKADGTVVAWGAGKENLGKPGSYGQSMVPPDLTNVVAIATSVWHNLALKEDGTVAAWGWNDWGQLNVPRGVNIFVAIAAGHGHSLALIGDGRHVQRPLFPPQRPALKPGPSRGNRVL